MRVRALFALALVFATPATAQSIGDAAWLAGRWVGEGLGGKVEETWAPAAGGQMVGHFQLVKEGKPVFYELMLLDARPDGLRLRVKHFNPDFSAWEDKAVWHSFEPVAVEPDRLRFKGLVLARAGDRLTVTVALKGRDGKVVDHVLKLRRAPL
jgi:uncharacterized protein DUF6265